jgi:hypothetical protein
MNSKVSDPQIEENLKAQLRAQNELFKQDARRLALSSARHSPTPIDVLVTAGDYYQFLIKDLPK